MMQRQPESGREKNDSALRMALLEGDKTPPLISAGEGTKQSREKSDKQGGEAR